MSSFQGVGIEGFHSIQRCPHFRGVSYTEVSSFQRGFIYRGVLISGGWNRGVSQYTEVSSFQGVGMYTEVSSFQGVGIEGFHSIQRCPHFRGLE